MDSPEQTGKLRFLADENFNNDLLRALRRRLPDLDVVRAQDTTIAAADDPNLLAWAADQGRILLTHDARTLPGFANERLRAALPLPGVVVVATSAALGDALEELHIMIEAGDDDDWPDQVRFVPLR